jgi:diguanylate cyclase (GGDEF)-like protein/PAS domain S-box-containing protein
VKRFALIWRWCGNLLLGGLLSFATEAGTPPAQITVTLDDNYPPYIFRNSAGTIDGYLVDVWKLWQEKTGIEVKLVATDWAKAQRLLADGQADVIDTIFRTPEREHYLEFTRPYAELPVPIYVHRSIGGITDLQTLHGFSVGVKEGDACVEMLKVGGVTTLSQHGSYEKIVTEAVAGNLKVFCLDEPPANYLLYKNQADSEFRKAFTLYSGQFHRAVRKGEGAILQQVQFGFDQISPAEYKRLEDKWMGTRLDPSPWGRYVIYGLAVAVLLGVVGLLWGLAMRRLVRTRTQELERERLRQHLLINTLPDMVWLKDPEGVYLACNAEFEQFFGASEKEILGSTDYDFVSKELADFFRANDRLVIEAGGARINEEEVAYASDGHRVMLETIKTPMFDKAGKLVGVLGIGRDITERKRDAEKLRLAGCVFDSTAEGIMITNLAGEIVAVNTAFESITGYSQSEVLGLNPRLLRSGRHQLMFYQGLWAALLEAGLWQGEIWNRRKNGEIYPNWQTISAVKDGAGVTTHFVGVFSDITTIKSSQDALDFLAHHDPLTELPNRTLFHDRLKHALLRRQREEGGLAVLFVDLDRFKHINDTLGHPVGDEVLRRVAKAMVAQVRAGDTVARIGGDEFVLLLEDDVSLRSVAMVAQKLVDLVSSPFVIDGKELYVTASIGISLCPNDGDDADSLLKNADMAMYKAKQQGRNNFQFYEAEMGKGAHERLVLENALRGAVRRNELFLHYQPQVDLVSGRLAGVEALVRWQHPELGLVSPGRFIPVAEDMGVIQEIGDWVLREACSQVVRWRDRGFFVPRMAVNLSMQQLEKAGLESAVAELLSGYNIPASQLELEVTESVIMNQSGRALETLDGLRRLGVFLAIDDFGTGYSSLSYLRQLPVHRLKIDYSFVRDIGRDPNDEAIALAIISLGHSLGLEVVAEGVERAEQADFLVREGCDVAQGYYFDRPVSPVDLENRWK